MSTAVVVRTSKGLVDALFDSIDALNSKKIDAEHARALSHTARAIVNIATLELEFRRYKEGSATQTAEQLKSLTIEDAEKKT